MFHGFCFISIHNFQSILTLENALFMRIVQYLRFRKKYINGVN
nr:MAG TPA: hypothetical protein [Caudoviricetes sp.]